MFSGIKRTTKFPKISNAKLKCVRFGKYSFDPEHLELSQSGKTIALKMQPARLLKLLLESAPDTLTRKTLQDKIWDNDTTIEFEQGLNVCVNQLRLALGDSASHPTYIATLPKRGYRFVAPVDVETKSVMRNKYGLTAIFTMLFVLVFGAVWFVNSRIEPPIHPRIYVSPIEFVDAGLDTHASLIQYGLRLGIIDQLIRGTSNDVLTINGETLWADEQLLLMNDKVDYRLVVTVSSDDVIYIANVKFLREGQEGISMEQSFHIGPIDAESLSHTSLQIARWAALLLGTSLSTDEINLISHDPDYFEVILKAKRALTAGKRSTIEESLKLALKALTISPSSAEAKGIVAITLLMLVGTEGYPTDETYLRAQQYADEIRVMVATAESELTRGRIALYRDNDLRKAKEAYDLALELEPGNALVHSWRAGMLAITGDVTSAAFEADIAAKLDPLSISAHASRCLYLRLSSRFNEAVTACEMVWELEPEWFETALNLALSMEAAGRESEAATLLDDIFNTDRIWPRATPLTVDAISDRKLSDIQQSYCDAAWRMEDAQEGYSFPNYYVAAMWSRCGEFDRAANVLKRAYKSKEDWLLFYPVDPMFDLFRDSAHAKSLDTNIIKKG